MDAFRAGVTPWKRNVLGSDWREDFAESLILTPLPEAIEASPTPSLSPQTEPSIQLSPLPDSLSREETAAAVSKAKSSGKPLSGLTESELMPKKPSRL